MKKRVKHSQLLQKKPEPWITMEIRSGETDGSLADQIWTFANYSHGRTEVQDGKMIWFFEFNKKQWHQAECIIEQYYREHCHPPISATPTSVGQLLALATPRPEMA